MPAFAPICQLIRVLEPVLQLESLDHRRAHARGTGSVSLTRAAPPGCGSEQPGLVAPHPRPLLLPWPV